jgi:hypothetical protein
LADVVDGGGVPLVIRFTGAASLDAVELASILKDLSADYKKLTRGRLMLVKYETGSALFYLTDALIVAGLLASQSTQVLEALKSIANFANVLKDFLLKAKTLNPLTSTGQALAKSAPRMLKVAAEHNFGLEVTHSADHKAQTESFSIKMTHAEAQLAYERLVEGSRRPPKLVEQHSTLPTAVTHDVDNLVQSLSRFPSVSPDELESMVAAIVTALNSAGYSSLLPALASSLEGQGRQDIAAIVKRHI